MRETVYQEAVEVDADPSRVWQVLVDVESWPEWTPSMTTVRMVTPQRLGPGSRVAIKQPRLAPAEMTVDQYAEGRSFAWSSRMAGLRTIADHVLEPTLNGTRVTLAVTQSGPLAGFVRIAYGRMIRRYVHMEASGIKKRAEENSGGHGNDSYRA
jgi:uncharacterized protein YndB with AHSA1/START domain